MSAIIVPSRPECVDLVLKVSVAHTARRNAQRG
jgi:hypothetical protein